MKLKRRKVKRGRVEIIPMIDTIVILLIFYMTFSRFADAAKEGKIELPKTKAGNTLEIGPGQVVVNLLESDLISVDKTEYKMNQLPALLLRFKDGLPKDQRATVILRADRQKVTYKDLSDFMKMCAKAGIVDVTFATLEGGQ